MPFFMTDDEKKTDSRPRYTHIDAFCLVLVCVCALPCLDNVRAYVYVRLNVYKYKIMLISLN